MSSIRRRRFRRQDPPTRDHVYNSTDELLASRLRELRWPEPPPGFRERSLERYREWITQQQSGRQMWR